MELWVRSQDKEDLVKVENIRCWNETQIVVNVKTSFNNVDYVVVGEYETKERVLEVLYSIQRRIEYINNVDNNTFAECVYEMPKD